VGTVALLHLGGGYVYTALVLAMQLASVPGLFVEGRPLLGGPQSTVWLWLFWHLGPVLSVLFLALAGSGRTVAPTGRRSARLATATAVLAAAAVTGSLVFGFAAFLPVLDLAGNYRAITSSGLAPALQVLIAVTLAVLWQAGRMRNVLHVWLAMTLVALFCDNALTMLGGDRASFGWHAGRLVGLTGLSVLAVVYLSEIRSSYAQSVLLADRLASSNTQLDAEAQQSRLRVEDLLRADVRKDEFLAMLAHELRNPLAPMQSAADLLSIAHANGEVVRKTAAMLTRQVKQMSGLVEDLLDASRLSRGRAELQQVPLDVKEVLSQSVEQVTGLVEEKGHTLIVRMPAEDLLLAGDHRRLVQVFTNLLVNAARYTPRGGRLEVRLEGTAEEILVRFQDNGIGMSAELLARAFLLFSQGAPSPQRPQGGLGIGLTLVKGLVELHGGTVEASSAGEGQGTEMLVRLPRRLPATPAIG
jgi:signal transduction histidine kinase